MLDTNLLSARITDIFENFESDFWKSLCTFFDSKVYGIYQRMTEIQVVVNEIFLIPSETLQLYSEKTGKLIKIPVPSSHIGEKPISCRLFSARRREGMVS